MLQNEFSISLKSCFIINYLLEKIHNIRSKQCIHRNITSLIHTRMLQQPNFPGTGLLAGPPRELHAVPLEDGKLLLEWKEPEDGANATGYIIHWQLVANNTQPYYYNMLELDNVCR